MGQLGEEPKETESGTEAETGRGIETGKGIVAETGRGIVVETERGTVAETERGTRGGTAATGPDDPLQALVVDGGLVVVATPGTDAAEGLEAAGKAEERKRGDTV